MYLLQYPYIDKQEFYKLGNRSDPPEAKVTKNAIQNKNIIMIILYGFYKSKSNTEFF